MVDRRALAKDLHLDARRHAENAVAEKRRQHRRLVAAAAQLFDQMMRARLHAAVEFRVVAVTAGKQNVHRSWSSLDLLVWS